MLFNFNTVASLLALFELTSAASLQYKREVIETALYAYGTNISGKSVIYADGLAYIGDTGPSFASVVSNVILSTDSTDSSTPWTISSNTTSISGASMYIIPTSSSTEQVGFVTSNGTTPTGAATTGFTWFGTTLAYITSDGNYEMKFWAVATNETDLWSLVWNSDGALIENATPVTLKRTTPAVVSE
ncbi:hypothetical protein B0O99DRAFT_679416 [Bisporella sp. PMI_857]|nr:hypothetical protein B0O99DRAFT_679416 [Bisporella sp. PMI_857]